MDPVENTAEILAFHALNKSVDEKWAVWAIDMLERGFDTEHLRVLAGIEKSYNQFYLNDLMHKVFKELRLEYTNTNKIIKDYVLFLINKSFNSEKNTTSALRTIKDIYLTNNFPELNDFYLLYWAKEDLVYWGEQRDWPGADKTNIDNIIQDYFLEWKRKYNRTQP